jgi:hypothetical protein
MAKVYGIHLDGSAGASEAIQQALTVDGLFVVPVSVGPELRGKSERQRPQSHELGMCLILYSSTGPSPSKLQIGFLEYSSISFFSCDNI